MAVEAHNFLGLEAEFSDYRKSQFAILPIPYDGTVSYIAGTRHGPQATITASQQVELYDSELGQEYFDAGIATLDALQPNSAGPEATLTDIYDAARRILADRKFMIALGGEHSISSPLVRAALETHGDLSVLQIDAHADLRDSYQGSPFSHACVMRRVHDMGVNFCGVGIRSFSVEEARFMEAQSIRPISARECHDSNDWIDAAIARLEQNVYVTVDIDGLDPSEAPGTGTPEPGGLSWYQVTDLLRAVTARRRVVAADVVEVIPVPGQAATEFLAAKLVYKIIAYVQAGH